MDLIVCVLTSRRSPLTFSGSLYLAYGFVFCANLNTDFVAICGNYLQIVIAVVLFFVVFFFSCSFY